MFLFSLRKVILTIGNNLEICILPDLNEDEKIHIFVTHDESTFHSNDGTKSGWGPSNQQPLLKKGEGRGYHVSDFLCESIGRLKLSPEVKERINDEKFPTEARVFLSIGKQHEGYWNIQKLAEQVKYCVINIIIIEFFY